MLSYNSDENQPILTLTLTAATGPHFVHSLIPSATCIALSYPVIVGSGLTLSLPWLPPHSRFNLTTTTVPNQCSCIQCGQTSHHFNSGNCGAASGSCSASQSGAGCYTAAPYTSCNCATRKGPYSVDLNCTAVADVKWSRFNTIAMLTD